MYFVGLYVVMPEHIHLLVTEPEKEPLAKAIPKYGETRCYIHDPDGYRIEVGQSTDLKYG